MNYKPLLDWLRGKPALYQPCTAPFWDDPHISVKMLEAHLAPDVEAASRTLAFMEASARWIADQFMRGDAARLLDLGCGPGIYAELFCRRGFQVTGVDFSARSVDYAVRSAAAKQMPIQYQYANYLAIDFECAFDAVTLIYCDFGVLPPKERGVLLRKIRRALKPGGTLILDGFTQRELERVPEGRTVEYAAEGFWSSQPYLCVKSTYHYPETANYLEQSVVVTERDCQCYNLWNQVYTAESLRAELAAAGFTDVALYDDVAGKAYSGGGSTVCAAASVPLAAGFPGTSDHEWDWR